MTNSYFENGSKSYFENVVTPKKNEETIKTFDISTKKYNKTDMKVEIVEYEIKD